MAALQPVVCPVCGYNGQNEEVGPIKLITDAEVVRPVLGVTEIGKIMPGAAKIDGDTEENYRFFCVGCLHEWPMPLEPNPFSDQLPAGIWGERATWG